MRVSWTCAAVIVFAAGGSHAEDMHPLDRAPDVLARVAPHVEAVCGARFASPPRVVELTAREAADVFAEDLRPEFDRRYAALPEKHRAALLRQAAATSVQAAVARYSFSRKETIVVRETFDATALRRPHGKPADLLTVSVAHECVHALDDARFDLAKLYRGAADDEAVRAVAMIAEGRAVHLGCEAAQRAGVSLSAAGDILWASEPRTEREWHLRLTYELGAQFVADLVHREPPRVAERDGRPCVEWPGVALADAALANPPATTWQICVPGRWPDAKPDDGPAKLLARAGVAADAVRPLSLLQLLERYAAMKDLATAERLFTPMTGGAQALVGSTNCAALAFADEEAAKRYEEISKGEAATARRGTVVVRAIGIEQDAWLAKLAAALAEETSPPK